MGQKTKHIGILLLLFAITVCVRYPNLNRPLSKHHEFCTAIALRVMTIWHHQGAEQYRYNPVMTYGEMSNHYINNHASGSGQTIDEAGNYYYVSHPPLSYYAPYFVLRTLQVSPDALSLQIFHLFIHLLCGVLVYFIGRELLARPAQSSPIALITAGLYLFSPATLWFQSNVYMADTLVQVFFAAVILIVLWMWHDQKNRLTLRVILAFLLFCMCYTHWLGYFTVGTFLIGLSINQYRTFFLQDVLGPAFISSAAAFCLMVLQYAQINGMDAYLTEMMHRFSIRSSGEALSLTDITSQLGTLVFHYGANHLPLLIALICMAIYSTLFFPNKPTLKPAQKIFLFVALMPPLLQHVVLLDYSMHDFTTLYATIGFCGLFAILSKYLQNFQGIRVITFISICVMAVSIMQYYYINRPGEVSLSGDKYEYHKTLGKRIKSLPIQGRVLFLLNHQPSPQLIFYTKRNMQPVEDEQEARQFLNKHNRQEGLIIEIDGKTVESRKIIKRKGDRESTFPNDKDLVKNRDFLEQ